MVIRMKAVTAPLLVCPDLSGRCRVSRLVARRRRTSPAKQIVTRASSLSAVAPGFKLPVEAKPGPPVAAELPDPPEHVTIGSVLPYLLKATFTSTTDYRRVWLAAAFVIISKAAGLLAPYFLKVSVERLGQGAAYVAHCIANIMMFGLCRVISSVAGELQFPTFYPVAAAVGRRITHSVFRHVLDLDLEYHLNSESGAMTAKLERGNRSIQHLFRAVVFRFFPTIVELVAVAVIFAKVFTPAAAMVIVAAVTGYVLFSVSIVSVSVGYRRRMRDLENRKTGKTVDVLQNVQTVLLFDNQLWEADQYGELLENYEEANIHYEQILALFNTGQTLIITLGLTMCLAVTVMASPGGRLMTAADLVLMQGIILQLWSPLSFFGWLYRETRQSMIDMQDFLQILRTKNLIEDGHVDLNATRKEIHHVNGASSNGSDLDDKGIHLRFEGVKFSYTPERNVLKCIDLDIPAGSSIAFVGHSGSGKSTLLSLLARLYDVEAGKVTYDGIDVREFTRSSLRSVIGVVPQETVLFNDTIYNNILYGQPTASREQVIQASKMASLDQAIRRLPDGYDTLVGERGLKLSGGEKQRVAIARAFLRKPKILVCDEATSSLDSATELDIMESLSNLAKGRTSIFVAHRLSTIQNCDKIVVLSDGRIIEQGTHDELLQLGLAYFDMWQSQARRDAFDVEYLH